MVSDGFSARVGREVARERQRMRVKEFMELGVGDWWMEIAAWQKENEPAVEAAGSYSTVRTRDFSDNLLIRNGRK